MAIVSSVHQWSNYLLGWRFRIRTDHKSLNYLLEQRISTMDQQRWLVKLMWYDYEIEYRPGHENLAADALSRLHGELTTITRPRPTWLAMVRHEAHNNPLLISMRNNLQKDTKSTSGYEARGGQLWYKVGWSYLQILCTRKPLFKSFTIHPLEDIPGFSKPLKDWLLTSIGLV